MKKIGARRERGIAELPDGLLLVEGAHFNEGLAGLAQTTFVPKGVYRFRSHADANRHYLDCLVSGMGLLAMKRS